MASFFFISCHRSRAHSECFPAQWVYGERPTRTISAPALRAPEVILGADYGTQVDIWAIGCMVCFNVPPLYLCWSHEYSE